MQPSKKRTRKEAFSDSESDFDPEREKPKAGKRPHAVEKAKPAKNNEEETKSPPKVKVDKIITDYKWKVHPVSRKQPEKALDKS